MLYRKIPQTGEELSILGFGCMRLPVDKDGKIDEEQASARLYQAIDMGVNYLDTAWPYHGGEGEGFLGRALKNGYRQKVKLATKLPPWLIKSREDMDYYLNQQLQRLQTDCIDYYLLHALDGISWDSLTKIGVADFLDTALKDGRIGKAGFSFHGPPEDFIRIVDAYPFTFCQIQYNFLDREYQAGKAGLKYAAQKGLAVIVMEPLRGGNLGLPEAPPAIARIWQSAKQHRTPVEWALRWVWNHPEVTVLLSGMNNEAHVAENLAIARQAEADSLTEEELEIVDRAAEKYKELMQVGCTGCGYCVPCPADVAIPAIFEVYNKMHMFGNTQEGRLSYALRMSGELTGKPSGFASQCVQCGECVEKCPQGIMIPDRLEEVVLDMEGDDLQQRIAMGKKILRIS